MDGGERQDALHGGEAPVHAGQLLPLCEQEGLVERNPAANVRRPKVDYESRTLGLDRNELGAFLVQAGLGSARDHALASLLALNGLRISEALGADIDALEFERGHRTLKILRKGGKVAIIPLAPRTSRALDLYIGERMTGPIFVGAHGARMDRYAADRTVKRLARRAGIAKRISPTAFATRSSPRLWTQGYRCGMFRRRQATLIRERPCATTGDEDRLTATPPTSWQRSLPAPRGDLPGGRGRYRAPVTPARASYRVARAALFSILDRQWSAANDSVFAVPGMSARRYVIYTEGCVSPMFASRAHPREQRLAIHHLRWRDHAAVSLRPWICSQGDDLPLKRGPRTVTAEIDDGLVRFDHEPAFRVDRPENTAVNPP